MVIINLIWTLKYIYLVQHCIIIQSTEDYFKVIMECKFNIKCNLNGNLTNYESRSLEIDLIGFENIY